MARDRAMGVWLGIWGDMARDMGGYGGMARDRVMGVGLLGLGIGLWG